jgi:hypothetical protein
MQPANVSSAILSDRYSDRVVFSERRKYPRARFNRSAHAYHDLTGSRRCTIVDLSVGGARLCSDDELPSEFTLTIITDEGQRCRSCRVIWRLEHEYGVQFLR